MKKTILFLLSLFIVSSVTLEAQNNFTNPGFESWSGVLSPSANGWNTLGYMGINLCSITKSTQVHSGSYSIGISAKQLPALIASALNTEQIAVPGLLTNADINLSALIELMGNDSFELDLDSLGQSLNALTNVFTNGLSINVMPTQVNGYAKFAPVGDEFAILLAVVVSGTDTNRQVIGAGYASLGNTFSDSSNEDSHLKTIDTAFHQFNINILPLGLSNAEPSELIFIALMSPTDETATEFGTLYLDDISVDYTSSLNTIASKEDIALYPNPTTSSFRINTPNNSKITITNALGQTVFQKSNYTCLAPISITEKGVYFVQIQYAQKLSTQKLIVR